MNDIKGVLCRDKNSQDVFVPKIGTVKNRGTEKIISNMGGEEVPYAHNADNTIAR